MAGSPASAVVDDEVEDDGAVDDEALEVQKPRIPSGGRQPTRAEIEHHVATGHAQHRSWCTSCMRARGIAGRHEQQDRAREDADPMICIDYAYTKAADSEKQDDEEMETPDKVLMIVAKDCRTGTYSASALDAKGPTDYAVKWLCGLLRRLGYRRLILQSDGEPSVCALKNAVVLSMREVEIVLRESPAGEHQANGVAECAVREVKRQVRTLRYALEECLGPVPEEHPMLRWLPMAASDAISFYRIGKDGLTAEVRRTGRPWKKLVAEFGEHVYYRPAAAQQQRSGMQAKLYLGRYLGHHARTGSILIMTANGVVTAAGFRRMPAVDRWKTEGLNSLRGLPWDVSKGAPEAADAEQVERPPPRAIMLPLAPRRRYVTRTDLKKYGITIGCTACSDIAVHGKSVKPHSDECRARIGAHLETDPVGQERLQAHKRRRDEVPEEAVAQGARGAEPDHAEPDRSAPLPEPGHTAQRDDDMSVPANTALAGSPASAAESGQRGTKHSAAVGPAAEAKAKGPRMMSDGPSRSSTGASVAEAVAKGAGGTALAGSSASAAIGGQRGTKHSAAGSPAAEAKAKGPRLPPRRGAKREGQSLPEVEHDIHHEVVPTRLSQSSSSAGPATAVIPASAGAGSAGSSSDQALAVIPASAGPGTSVEDMIGPVAVVASGSSAASLSSMGIDGRMYEDFEKLVNLVRMSGAFPEEEPTTREVQEIAKICLAMCAVDLSEVYSPARFKERALQLGLSPGLAADLLTGWDLEIESQRKACSKQLANERPRLLIASPPCTAFSVLQNISKHKRDHEAWNAKLSVAKAHLEYATEECRKQMKRGGHFLFEQPQTAASWQERCVKELMEYPGVVRVVGPMCRWGLRAEDRRTGRQGFVRKPTAWLTNHPGLAEVLEGWCTCASEDGVHPYRHVHLMGGLAAPAARYPVQLVTAILKQLREDLREWEDLSDLAAYAAGPSPHEALAGSPASAVADADADTAGVFVDDVRGGALDAERVRAARREEVEWCRKMCVWERYPRTDMLAEGGRAISLRWVDTDKGDAQRPNYRSRLCVREIKKAMKRSEIPQAADLFSGMPPLEAVKALISIFVGHCQEPSKGRRSLMAFDISRAHFHGVPARRVFVELPKEEHEDIKDGVDYVGLLLKSMYGTVDASARWQAHYSQLLKEAGFAQGQSNPSLFVRAERDIRLLVHGDDFLVETPSEQARVFEDLLKSKYEFKCTGLFRVRRAGARVSLPHPRAEVFPARRPCRARGRHKARRGDPEDPRVGRRSGGQHAGGKAVQGRRIDGLGRRRSAERG